MNIFNVTRFIEARYENCKITPAELEKKIRAVITAMDICENPETVNIRFSIGQPVDPETNGYNDWKETLCASLSDLPDELKNKEYTVYEIWYDSDEEDEDLCGMEIMVYEE